MKNRIFGYVKPAGKTKYGHIQATSLEQSFQHGADYTPQTVEKETFLASASKHRIRTSLQTRRTHILKRYADWRVGALEAEKRAHKLTDTILFTFDDYGSAEQIHTLLDILGAESVRAAFFLQGDWAELHPQLVEDIREAGHIVGNHTHSHADLLSLTDAEVEAEIAGGPESTWLRPPRGRYNARIRKLAAAMGKSIFYWSIDSDDWQGVPVDYMKRKIMSELAPGAVILFHIHADNTALLLPDLITSIRAAGYELCTPDEDLESCV